MRKSWEAEKRQLLGENAVLQDATKRLNQQVRSAEDELRRVTETGKLGDRARADVEEVSESILERNAIRQTYAFDRN